MDTPDWVEVFFQRRWPDGFSCPTCAHRSYFTIRTRRLPLYECRFCGRQTSVTAGTVMDKTRIPLAKWAAAIEALASTNGLNEKQLAQAIGVSHKSAWLMLRKFRQAIGETEAAMNLRGKVHTGLEILAPKYIFILLPQRRYRCERVVAVSVSIGTDGSPRELKLSHVHPEWLIPKQKEPTGAGRSRIVSSHAHEDAQASGNLLSWQEVYSAFEFLFRQQPSGRFHASATDEGYHADVDLSKGNHIRKEGQSPTYPPHLIRM